tara:strand:+ start:1569 stop:2102 length:534 start_codon:yes stop_codon:yes gene_type:complete
MASINVNNLPAKAAAAITALDNVMLFTASGDTTQTPFSEAVSAAQVLNDCECLKSFKVTLTSAEILALGSTPINLIAAPDAGYCIDIVSVAARLNYGTVDYVGGGNLILYAVGSNPLATITNIVQGSASVISKGTTIDGSDIGNLVDSQPIKVLMLVSPTTGDSTITIFGLYREMKL